MKKNLFKLFLCLLALFTSTGEAWAVVKYYKIHVIAIDQNGEQTDAGKVFVYEDALSATYSGNEQYLSFDTITGPWKTNAGGSARAHFWAQEIGSTFLGWYREDKTTQLIAKASNNKKKDYVTNFTAAQIAVSDEDDIDHAPMTTIYGKFQVAPKVRYFTQLNFDESAQKRGSVHDYVRFTDSKYAFAMERYEDTRIGSGTIKYYPLVTVKRGYHFDGWSVSGTHTSLTGSSTTLTTEVTITTTSTDTLAPETGTLSASFSALTPSVFTVQKDADMGTVYFVYKNNLENEAGDGLELRKDSIEMATSETEKTFDVYSTDTEVALRAIPAASYMFRGWYSVDEYNVKTFITDESTLSIPTNTTATYYAYFKPVMADSKYKVGVTGCKTFEEALAVATSATEDKVIIPLVDDEIAGNYTIPAGVTLLIPYAATQSAPDINVTRVAEEGIPTAAYRTLTLAEGAHLNVYGTIEVGGQQSTGDFGSGADIGIGRPAAPTYGYLVLNAGSKITLNDGSNLRAWGYVQGQGEIDARRGSKVFEQFQIMDWRGYKYTKRMFSNTVLPMTQYYIQNIESPTTYHPGAKLLACGGVRFIYPTAFFDASVVGAIDSVGIIGAKYNDSNIKDDAAIFLMDNEDDSEDTWVRKYYDPTTDRQVYEANNSAYLGSLKLKVRGMGHTFDVNSAEYVLPITNNFKIHLLTGEMVVTQNTVMLPGSEIEVNKKSTLTINAGQALSFYDTDQWDKYVCGHFVDKDTYEFTYASRIKYRPGGVPGNEARDISSAAALGNAKLTVHGSVNVEGMLFTTEGGASITSTKEDAGTILFTNAAPAVSEDHFVEQVSSTTPTYVRAQCVSALLTNEAGSSFGEHTATAETAAGKSFCFIDINEDGKCEWVCLTDDDMNCMVYDQGGVYYIKPNAYVPISSGVPTPAADHTYRDTYAGTDSIYIKTLDCQWWCVYPVEGHPGLFECRHKDNHTYYYYDDSSEDPEERHWAEKKFKVEWVNWDGSPVNYESKEQEASVNYYYVTYGTVPQWLSANPTRPDNANYSYTFTGWSPAFGPVTDSVKYVAQYTETPRKFLVTFKNEVGIPLKDTLYEYLSMPVAPTEGVNLTDYQWSPAISAVTGNQVYQLVAKPEKFTVIYKNWDGMVLQTTENIVSGTATPAAPVATRDDDALYSYAHNDDDWTPVRAATVTADAIYTATFTSTDRTHAIRFYQENGTTQIGTTQNLAHGATPAVPSYSKNPDVDSTYTLVWKPLVGTVTGAQDYVATFTKQPRQYTVTWRYDENHVIKTDQVNYGATPAYSGLTPTRQDNEKIYTFTGWTPALATVESNQVYTATFDEGHMKTVEVAVNGTNDLSGHVETLILNASEAGSGQLTGNITATTAYYDLQLNTASRTWHAFGVPWQVNLDTDPLKEIKTKDGDACDRTLVLGRDYEIVYYNGAKRAAQGAGAHCWEVVADGAHILQPGQGYMIAFGSDAGTLRFAKKNLAPVIFNGTMSVDANNGATDNVNGGWNAIANPMAYHVTMNAGPTTGYVHDGGVIGSDGYDLYNIENTDYIVGKAVFVQVEASQSVVIDNASGSAMTEVNAAPARRTKATDKRYLSLRDYYQIGIADANAQGGRVYVLPEEDKADEYVIGHDLSHLGISDQKAQIWVFRYGTKLALNTTAPVEGVTEYALRVYAPKNGEYTISNIQAPISNEDYVVYLTRDGEAIWNLSESAYTADLTSGVHKEYGLRLSARKSPTVVTGVDEAVVDAKGETRKVLINNQVFIIRGNEVYSIDGQLVK